MPRNSVSRRYWSIVPSGNVYSGSGTWGKPGSNTWKCALQLPGGSANGGFEFDSAGRIGVVWRISSGIVGSPAPVVSVLPPSGVPGGPRLGPGVQDLGVGP